MRIAIGVPFDVKNGNDSGFLTAFKNLISVLSEHELKIYAPNGGDVKLTSKNKKGNKLTKKYYNTLSLAKNFSKKIQKEKFDLIIAFTNMGLFLKQDHVYITSNLPFKKIIKIVGKEYPKNTHFKKLIDYYNLLAEKEEQNYKKAKKIFVYSREIKKSIIEEYKVPKNKIVYFQRHITYFKNSKNSKNSKLKIILMPSSLSVQKGIKVATKTMEILKIKEPNTILIICGKIDPYEEKYIKELLKKTKGKANILLTGYLPKRKFYNYLENADCAFMPFNYDECPISLSECLGHEIPIVTNKYAGYSKKIINSFGICIKRNNEKDYARALLKILRNEKVMKKKRENIKKLTNKLNEKKFKEKINNELLKISKA